MAVDDEVEQPVQQEPHAVLGQVRGVVPAGHDPVDVNRLSLRTVISACLVMNTAISLVCSSPLAVSRPTA